MTAGDSHNQGHVSHQHSRLTKWIAIGVLVGAAWGLFWGEQGAWVKWIGDVYVGLLQMTVLPYVAVSLICNIGRLTTGETGRLAKAAVGVLSLLWLISLLTLIALRYCFPAWDGGSFYSSSVVSDPEPVNWLELFIPSNPFFSLTNSLVPAVVLFSIAFGIALIPVSGKGPLLDNLNVVIDGLSRLNKLVLKLSPMGIFGIVGHAAGTISLEQFALLQGYLLVYIAAAFFLSLWVLPALVACCTPLSHRDILGDSRDAMISAFIIGNTFVVLPMIIDSVERLMRRIDLDPHDHASHAPGYTVQLAYPFPDVGRIVGLIFIPFAAWFYGSSIEQGQYVPLIVMGFVGSFAKLVVTIPMLLDMAELPTDILNLFLGVGVVASRFGDLMKTAHLLAFSLLMTCFLQGLVRIKIARSLAYGATTLAMLVFTILGIRAYLASSFQDDFSRKDLLVARQLLSQPVEFNILAKTEKNPMPRLPGEDRLDRILRRGVLRIGFDPRKLPFSYFNNDGLLVGFDVDMAHQLGRDLGVGIEFVPIASDVARELLEDRFDISMSGVEGTIERATLLPKMEPYMEVTRAMVVPDHRRSQFRSVDSMVKKFAVEGPLRVAYVSGSIASENLRNDRRGLGKAAAVVEASGLFGYMEFVELTSASEFFDEDLPIADVLIISAEEGSAWTLKHPQYAVVVPKGFEAKTPLYYFVAEESRLEEFIDSWLVLKRSNGTVQQLYDYWILGIDSKATPPRWCILRDVLHWGDR